MDIKLFNDNGYNDKFIYFDKSNFIQLYLMIIGPKGTPYEDGFLFFQLNFTSKYPYEPPYVVFLNKDKNVRIHPNLYSNGKVCLSILGTWPGPKWVPTMSLNTIALTLQSILCDNPLINEPSYYNKTLNNRFCKDYMIYCTFYKYIILVNNVIDNKYNDVSKYFKKEINEIYNKNKNNLNDNIESYKQIYGFYTIDAFPYYNMDKYLNFNELKLI